MRRSVTIIVLLALLAGTAVIPAEAAKKKKKPATVATKLFMHGQQSYGEFDGLQWFADGSGPESPMTIDGVAPDGDTKSMAIGSLTWNSECTGLPLGFPTFTGSFSGTITGDAKLTAYFDGSATAVARVWADMGAFQACNEEYVPPNAEVEFEAADGEVVIEFTDLNIPADASLMIEILIPERAAPMPRLQYDSAETATRFEFNCIPPAGATTCVEAPPAE